MVHLLLQRANPKVVWNVLQSKLLICLISSFQFFSFMSLFTKKMSAYLLIFLYSVLFYCYVPLVFSGISLPPLNSPSEVPFVL